MFSPSLCPCASFLVHNLPSVFSHASMPDKLITVSLCHARSRRVLLFFFFYLFIWSGLYLVKSELDKLSERRPWKKKFQIFFPACCVVFNKEHENVRTWVPDYERYRSNIKWKRRDHRNYFLQPKVSFTSSPWNLVYRMYGVYIPQFWF